jgi:aspartyl-tRNA(Asn)/glutamyl-tRNA(Gln) amidotransferase subunit A
VSSATELTDLTIVQGRDGLRAKAFTAVDLTLAHLHAIEALNPRLNAYLSVGHAQAMEQARAADAALAQGDMRPLLGIPLAIKDLFCTTGVRTTAGSKILMPFVPPYESTVTANLLRDGAVFLGKTNMDEFAMGSSNMTSYYGPVENPWKRRQDATAVLVPGGSSGGSAAAVAARLAMGGTGTDTGGSIRQPASFCGLVGVKPTYGRCSRWGVVAFASSLDHPGPFARTVRDCAILLGSMAGHDPKDSTSADVPVPDYEAACERPIKGLRIGVPREYRADGMPGEIEALWQRGVAWLRDAGAEIVDVSLPHTKYGLATYYIIAPAEASSNLARYDGVRFGLREDGEDLRDLYERTRAAGFGAEVRDFTEAFAKVDALLTPTAPSAAFAQGEKMDDPITMYLNDLFTVPADLAGVPAMSVPGGLDADGLPLGLQIIARPFDEATMFAVAAALERAAGFVALPTLRAGG